MTFEEQVVATLIGTSGGFIGSVVLFWMKQCVEKNRKENTLVRNLYYEIKYNITLMNDYDVQLTKCIEAIEEGQRQMYLNIDYSLIAKHFSIQFYREGLISKFLHPDDMKRWNGFLSTLSEGSETYVQEILGKWRENAVDQKAVLEVLKLERNQVQYAREMSEYLNEKIAAEKGNAVNSNDFKYASELERLKQVCINGRVAMVLPFVANLSCMLMFPASFFKWSIWGVIFSMLALGAAYFAMTFSTNKTKSLFHFFNIISIICTVISILCFLRRAV